MERLTVPIEDSDDYKTAKLVGCHDDPWCEGFYDGHCADCMINIRAVEQLARYEDDIEEGRLIELPYKIYQLVYTIEKDEVQKTKILAFEIDEDGIIVCVEARTKDGACRGSWHRISEIFLSYENAETKLRKDRKDLENKNAGL